MLYYQACKRIDMRECQRQMKLPDTSDLDHSRLWLLRRELQKQLTTESIIRLKRESQCIAGGKPPSTDQPWVEEAARLILEMQKELVRPAPNTQELIRRRRQGYHGKRNRARIAHDEFYECEDCVQREKWRPFMDSTDSDEANDMDQRCLNNPIGAIGGRAINCQCDVCHKHRDRFDGPMEIHTSNDDLDFSTEDDEPPYPHDVHGGNDHESDDQDITGIEARSSDGSTVTNATSGSTVSDNISGPEVVSDSSSELSDHEAKGHTPYANVDKQLLPNYKKTISNLRSSTKTRRLESKQQQAQTDDSREP